MDSSIFATAREVVQLGGPVVRLYQTAFGRVPDDAGLRDFVAFLRTGGTPEAIAEQLAASVEFGRLHGDAPDLVTIRRLYENATGHPPSDVEIVGPLAQAAAGETRAGLLAGIAASDAARAAVSLLRVLGPPRARPEDETAYQLWLAEYPDLADADHAAIHRDIAAMPTRPLLTLLMVAPQYRGDLALETIASIRHQLYPAVELRIALPDDATQATRAALTRAAHDTPGIVLVAGASVETAFAAAAGEFAGIVEPGDQLAPDALYRVARAITPEVAIIYTDEDRIEGGGRRYAPRFKTGPNPDLLLAGDCIGQLAMIRATAWREAGGLRDDAAPYERFDLVLRVLEASPVTTHIPAILFHRGRGGRRRQLDFPDCVATSLHPRMRDMVQAHMARGHSPASLDETIIGGRLWPRIRFPVPEPAPLVSVIIPTRDRADLLETCLTGLLNRTDYPALEVLIADNDSVEPATFALFAQLARDPRVRVLPCPGPFNYSAMNNEAARQARGEVLLLLNNDVEVTEPGWLGEMVGHALRPDVGAVGAKLLYPAGNLQHAGLMLGPDGGAKHILRWAGGEAHGYLGQLALTRDVAAVTGACLAIRRAVFEQVGGLEQEHLRVTWSDIDLCLRIRAHGYRVVWTPHAVLTHAEQASRGSEADSAERQSRFEAERGFVLSHWGAAFDDDPYQNPGLTATDDDLVLATPPRRKRPWAA